jgi:uncharacterized membrane protein
MAIKKLEELTNEQLKKRDKVVTSFLIVFVIVFLLLAVLNLVLVFLKHTNSSALMPVFSGLIIIVPIAIGRKKIKEELKKRENET